MEDKTIKKYSWSSTVIAKSQYDDWLAYFTELCEKEKVGFCVDVNFAHLFRPQPHEEALGDGLTAQAAYRKEVQDYKNRMTDYHNKYMIATGLLKSTLAWKTKVRTEVDMILKRIPPHPLGEDGLPVVGWAWYPDDAFKAALDYIKTNYAPSDASDVAHLNQMISELSDNIEGGFEQYAESFNMYYSALVNAGKEPEAKQATAWVLKGLQNSEIRGLVTGVLFANRPPDQEPTYKEIFSYVEHYLKRIGEDQDPYKAIKTNPNGPPRVSANAINNKSVSLDLKNEKRCTKCWRKGHVWSDCHAGTCSICGRKINVTFCDGWQTHTEPGTRWIPLKFRSDINESQKKQVGKRKTSPNANEEKDPEILEKLKVLQAARKDIKRLRKEKKKEP